jgi:hypothetical protein
MSAADSRRDKLSGRDCTMRLWFWLILGGLPLMIYPFLLVANIMSLAGNPSSDPASLVVQLASQGFLWGSTLYPLVYILCALIAVVCSFGESDHIAVRFALIPIVYLAAVIICFLLWLASSS